jgi:hypothetical protein
MKINIRMEGGLGDHLLANRFVPAILDKYPEAQIKIFSDTENNPRSLDLLLNTFPSFYNRGGEVIKSRKNKEFTITSQFGPENYPSSIDNQTDEIKQIMINECDKFYDLHIDSLRWLDHDYDWFRYYYFFPKPQKTYANIYESSYVMTHLYSRPNSPYNLDKQYSINLLKQLSQVLKVVVVIEEQYKDYYQELFDNNNIIINTASSIDEIFSIASHCSCFFGIDSGIRYIPYHFGKPTFVFSKYCSSYGNVAYSHLVRWLIYKQYVLPMHIDIDIISKIVYNINSNQAYSLFPEIPDSIDQYIVRRKYE